MVSKTSSAFKKCRKTVKHSMKISNNSNPFLKIVLRNYRTSTVTSTEMKRMMAVGNLVSYVMTVASATTWESQRRCRLEKTPAAFSKSYHVIVDNQWLPKKENSIQIWRWLNKHLSLILRWQWKLRKGCWLRTVIRKRMLIRLNRWKVSAIK